MGRVPPGALSLRRGERLRRASEIQALFRQGNRDEQASFVALWRQRDRGRRVGFAASRRTGGAVERNRVRRRIREAYRREQRALRASVDVLFIGRPSVLGRRFTELAEEMRRALERLSRNACREGGWKAANE